MNAKKIIAAALSFCMLGGTLPYKTVKDITHAVPTTPTETDDYILGDQYYYDKNTRSLIIYSDIRPNTLWLFEHREEVLSIYTYGGNFYFPYDSSGFFMGFSNCKEIDLSDAVSSNITDVSSMFMGCTSLETIIAPDGIFESVTDAAHMFEGCKSLTSVRDLFGDEINMPSAETVDRMFYGCSSLKDVPEIQLSVNPDARVSANSMFEGCSSIDTIKFKSDLNKPTYLSRVSDMFKNCSDLSELDLGNLDSSYIEPDYRKNIFLNCIKLQSPTIDNYVINHDSHIPKIIAQPPSEVYFDDYGTAHIPIIVEGKNCIIQWYVKNKYESGFGLYDDDYLYNQDGEFIWPGYLDFANNDGKGLSYALFDGAEMYFLVKSLDYDTSVKSDIVTLKRRHSDVDRNTTIILPQAGQTLSEYTSQEDFLTMKELIFDKYAFHISYKDKNNKIQTMKPTDTFIADVDYTFFIKAYLPPHIFPSEIYTFINKGLIINGIENSSDGIYDEEELSMANEWFTKASYTVAEGDINCDKRISIADAVRLQKYILDPNRTIIPNWHNADINKDNVVDVFDLIVLKQNCLNQK